MVNQYKFKSGYSSKNNQATKYILLILTLTLLTQTSFSQSTNSWLDAGSDWHYATYSFMPNYGYSY